MSSSTFSNTAADGDYANAANWNNGVPDSTVDAILAASGSTGSFSCKTLTDSGTNPITGGNITVHAHTITGAKLSGGTITMGSGLQLSFIGGAFNSGGIAFTTYLNSSSSFAWNADAGGEIRDDGTATYGAITISSTIISPAMTNDAAATFNGPVTCSNINMPSAIFNGGITQTGDGVTLKYASLGAAVTWTSVTSVADVACAGYSVSGNTASFLLLGSGGTVSYTAFASASNVKSGVVSQTGTGTLIPSGGIIGG